MNPLKKGRVFYGWWMILVIDAIAIYAGGVWFYGFGAFLKPICDEFGWSRAVASAGFSLARLEAAGTGIPAGYLSDKFGPRRVMLIGIVITGIGFLLFSRINSLWSFFAIFILTSLGYGFGFFVPMATAVANWFNKKIGKAMGLFQGGYAGCGFVTPVLVLLINNYGWRNSLFIIGVAMWIICIPLTLFIRHRPEKYGYLPDGESPQAAPQKGIPGSVQGASALAEVTGRAAGEFTLRESLREPSFWLISLSFGLASFTFNALIVHEIAYLISIGISDEVAAWGITCILVTSFLGRIGIGWLADVFSKRLLMAICYIVQFFGLLIFARVSAIWPIFLSLALFGPGYGGVMVLRVAIQRAYFGRESFGAAQGVMLLVVAVPSALGPIFAGWVFDVVQSYRPAFLIGTIAYVLATALILLAKPPRKAQNIAQQPA